jgi:hypothetical protein
MADEARLAIIIQEGAASGSGLSAAGPAPQARPATPPPATSTAGAPGAFPATAALVPAPVPRQAPMPAPPKTAGKILADELKAPWETAPPPVRFPGPPAPAGAVGAPAAEGALAGASKAAGSLTGALAALTMVTNTVTAAFQISGRMIDKESAARSARIRGDVREEMIARRTAEIGPQTGALIGAPVGAVIGGIIGSIVPGVGTAIGIGVGTVVGGLAGGGAGALNEAIAERRQKAIRAQGQTERDYLERANRLAPVSGQVAGAQLQARFLERQGLMAEERIYGGAAADMIRLTARRDVAIREREAQQSKREMDQLSSNIRVEAGLQEIANRMKEGAEKQAINRAIDDAMAGDVEELLKLAKRYEAQLRERERKGPAEGESQGQYFLDMMRGNIGKLPQQADQARIAGADQAALGFVPMF